MDTLNRKKERRGDRALLDEILDGLAVAHTLFDHSMNYRSAVVRGTIENPGVDPREALNVLGDSILPGRSTEVRPHTGKEIAATIVLSLPIIDGQWITKARAGGPGTNTSDDWTGHVPMRTVYDAPVTETEGQIPESVRRLTT